MDSIEWSLLAAWLGTVGAMATWILVVHFR
jgi:hypothetical protein